MLALLAACTVNRAIPSGRLLCDERAGCPEGYRCVASGGKNVCCRDGDCGDAPTAGTGPATPGTGGVPTAGGGGAPTAGTGGVPTAGVPTDAAAGDAPCSSECQPGQTRCVPGGVQACVAATPCLRWGTTAPAPPGACALQLVDDGVDERDVAPTCAGNLCLIGGLTP